MDPKKYRNKCYGRKSSESLQELTAKVERLSALAYPGATIEMRDILAVDAFIEALDNTALRYKLQEREPSSPRDALVTAMKLESLMQARDIAKDQVDVHFVLPRQRCRQFKHLDKLMCPPLGIRLILTDGRRNRQVRGIRES